MPDKFDMSDYVPVNERIEAFYKVWTTGTLQSEIVELTDSRVTVKAYAYRTEDDARPGIGHSSVVIPGATPYTRGSEIENAETSAWGRAIAALGFEVKRGIASSEEVRNKQPGQGRKPEAQPRKAPAPVQYRRDELAALMALKHLDNDSVLTYAAALGIPSTERPMSDKSMDILIDAIGRHGEPDSMMTEQAAGSPAAVEPEAGSVAQPAPAASTVEEAIAKAEKRAKVTA